MKTHYFQNVRNREQFYCKNTRDIRLIDGIEYLKVFRLGTQHEVLVKKESLQKVAEPK
jgi:hypothetical protein